MNLAAELLSCCEMKKQHILLACEKRENALPLSLFLEGQNFRVSVEENGEHLVKKIRDRRTTLDPFALLIVGTQMSERSLLELLSELKSLKISLPFIIVSDNGNPVWLNRLMTQRGGGYVVKPSEPTELVKVVQCILRTPAKERNNG